MRCLTMGKINKLAYKRIFYLFFIYCSRSIQLSLSVLLLGVGIATVTDLQLNALGSILSLLAILTTCVAQIVSLNYLFVLISHLIETFKSRHQS